MFYTQHLYQARPREMDVPEFDRIAREVFPPVSLLIAEQIKEITGITEGVCLDIGAGGGYLGIALGTDYRSCCYSSAQLTGNA